MTINHIIHN